MPDLVASPIHHHLNSHTSTYSIEPKHHLSNEHSNASQSQLLTANDDDMQYRNLDLKKRGKGRKPNANLLLGAHVQLPKAE